jgi:hypothetical protein
MIYKYCPVLRRRALTLTMGVRVSELTLRRRRTGVFKNTCTHDCNTQIFTKNALHNNMGLSVTGIYQLLVI